MKRCMKGLVLILAVLFIWVSSATAEVVRGTVSTIDLKANRIALQADGQDHNFSFDPQDFIVWQGDDEVKAEQIKTGADAEVGYYTDERGIRIASWVDLTPLEEGEALMIPPADILPLTD